jgi:hypothetical protein
MHMPVAVAVAMTVAMTVMTGGDPLGCAFLSRDSCTFLLIVTDSLRPTHAELPSTGGSGAPGG